MTIVEAVLDGFIVVVSGRLIDFVLTERVKAVFIPSGPLVLGQKAL